MHQDFSIKTRDILRIASAMMLATISASCLIPFTMGRLHPDAFPYLVFWVCVLVSSVMMGFNLKSAGWIYIFGFVILFAWETVPNMYLIAQLDLSRGLTIGLADVVLHGFPAIFFYAFIWKNRRGQPAV